MLTEEVRYVCVCVCVCVCVRACVRVCVCVCACACVCSSGNSTVLCMLCIPDHQHVILWSTDFHERIVQNETCTGYHIHHIVHGFIRLLPHVELDLESSTPSPSLSLPCARGGKWAGESVCSSSSSVFFLSQKACV